MRSAIRNLVTITFTVVALACSKEEPAPAATNTTTTSTAAAPALPADVAGVSAAATPAAAPGTDTAAAPGAVATATAVDANTIVATGEFVSPVRSELAAKVIGRVSKMYVDEGSRVTKGQALFQLETDYIGLNLRAADADIARARAAENEAQRDLARKQELVGKNSIPRATFDRSQAMYDQARAGRASAEAHASLLRQQAADSTVRSPINGIVAEKRTEVGAKLGDGNVAMVIVQMSPLKLRFRVPERYLGKLKIGDAVSARVDPYPNETFEGTIKTIGGVIDPATRTMFAEAEFPNRDGRLRPGLFARVEAKMQ
jgi:membrane fusion protein (multidrug efflux system)